ncbi:AbrB/MazE/SpoVT family DNA-binding domain-containing protein [Pseudomonas asiatica]|uniref:AbrB family transcriptional regulator n=1 Tax=Pseudomonas asiatica TaxID=2219225 RepID=UPI00383BD158
MNAGRVDVQRPEFLGHSLDGVPSEIQPLQLVELDRNARKVRFRLQVLGIDILSRVETTHEDPAIGAFLGLLEADIRGGRNLTTLPEDLAQTMLANANHSVNLDEDIDGEVAI